MEVPTVSLSPEEVRDSISLAHKRHDAKDPSFRHKRCLIKNAKSTAVPHEIGILGEVAYGKYVGLEIDREIYDVRDGGSDFKDVEVKTVTYFGPGEPELKIPEKDWLGKHKDIKKFVLVRLDKSLVEASWKCKIGLRVELLGEIARTQFDKFKKTKTYGLGKPLNYVVRASQLRAIEKEDDFGF
jgi:hypothetical protein